jgi:hypothetical protein
LSEKLILDMLWEKKTKLKGTAKTKAFIERVLKDNSNIKK